MRISERNMTDAEKNVLRTQIRYRQIYGEILSKLQKDLKLS